MKQSNKSQYEKNMDKLLEDLRLKINDQSVEGIPHHYRNFKIWKSDNMPGKIEAIEISLNEILHKCNKIQTTINKIIEQTIKEITKRKE